LKEHVTVAVLLLSAVGCQSLPNLAPTASFVYSPVSPIFAGQTSVRFDASASEDGDGRIVEYAWDFGDDTAGERQPGPVTTHVFPVRSGCLETVLTAQLTVTDDTGLRGFASQRIAIQPPPGAPGCPAAAR
jgi:PKD repeat protein